MKFLVLIGAVQGLFLSLALFFKKEKHGKFLSLFLFLFTIELFTEFLAIDVKSKADLTYFNIPVFLFENAIFLLYGPVFYFYVSFITAEKEKLRRKDLLHFIPFILFFLFLSGFFIYIAVTGIENLKESKETKGEIIFSAIVNITFYLQVLVYIYFSRRSMNNYKKRILQNFSDIHKISCRWLSILIYAISFAWAATFFSTLCSIAINETASNIAINVFFVAVVIMFFSIGYFVLLMPDVYGKIHSEFKEDSVKNEKYKKNFIEVKKKREYIANINKALQEDKLYLESEITIRQFSESTGIPAHHLSQVLNDAFGKNFYTFINEFRVEYAAKLLSENPSANILSVCFQSGFNSKSVFNDVFKKFKGFTPSEFREKFSSRMYKKSK